MKWISALGAQPDWASSLEDASTPILRAFGPGMDILLCFYGSAFTPDARELAREVQKRLSPKIMIGCGALGLIGAGKEEESGLGISLLAGNLEEGNLHSFRLTRNQLPNPDSSPSEWKRALNLHLEDTGGFILLADPFSMPVKELLAGLDYAFPGSKICGGLASGAAQPGENMLLYNGECLTEGAVGFALSGSLVMDTVVSQGCRAIGETLRVTKGERNFIFGLNGESPLMALSRLAQKMSDRDRGLMQHSLFLGIRQEDPSEPEGFGGYLIRHIVGIDPQKGILAIGDSVRPGQTVQFHLRDAQTSSEDLVHVLRQYKCKEPGSSALGALLFACCGRGKYLYGRENHDTKIFHSELGVIPMSGFFCNGEIGPIGSHSHLHGYTSCFALFRKK